MPGLDYLQIQISEVAFLVVEISEKQADKAITRQECLPMQICHASEVVNVYFINILDKSHTSTMDHNIDSNLTEGHVVRVDL